MRERPDTHPDGRRVELPQRPDEQLAEPELAARYRGYKPTTVKSLMATSEKINYELIRDVVLWIVASNADVSKLPKQRQGVWGEQQAAAARAEKAGIPRDDLGGAILIFLPVRALPGRLSGLSVA